jgi:hypothetical protein
LRLDGKLAKKGGIKLIFLPMNVMHSTLVLILTVSGLTGQEGGGGPMELVQLRNAWKKERMEVDKKVDAAYLESLEMMKKRLIKHGQTKAVEAVDKEIQERLAVTETREGRLPEAKYAKGEPREKVALTEAEREGLEQQLDGVVWRVDEAGEGLRWYYFETGGKAARKSKLTEWRWTDLDGEWEVNAQGVVTVTWPHATVQIFRSARGEPQISMNFEGTLSVRPFWRTDLKYPGVGKE